MLASRYVEQIFLMWEVFVYRQPLLRFYLFKMFAIGTGLCFIDNYINFRFNPVTSLLNKRLVPWTINFSTYLIQITSLVLDTLNLNAELQYLIILMSVPCTSIVPYKLNFSTLYFFSTLYAQRQYLLFLISMPYTFNSLSIRFILVFYTLYFSTLCFCITLYSEYVQLQYFVMSILVPNTPVLPYTFNFSTYRYYFLLY